VATVADVKQQETWAEYVKRVTRSMSQNRVAELTGIAQTNVGRWLRGEAPRSESAVQFARALGEDPLEALVAAGLLDTDELKTLRGEVQEAVWDVLVSCDHFGHQTAELDWDPSEGPRHQKCKKWRGLDEMLEVVAQGDPDKENYWRRMYAEDHPEPAPFVYCYTCARIRSIVAYQRIGWLEPKPKPAKPKPSPRTAMERRLKKLELEAADLRERLRNLPGAD